MNSYQCLRNIATLCAVTFALPCFAPLEAAQSDKSTSEPDTVTKPASIAATEQNIVALEKDIAALREKLHRTEDATADAAIARRVVDTEALLLKERQLIEQRVKLHEQQPDEEDMARRDVQKALNEAKDENERAAIRARHQAFQRVLAVEAAQAARAARPASRTENTPSNSSK